MIANLLGPAITEFVVLVEGAALVAAVCATAPAESRAATERVETILRVIVVALEDSLDSVRDSAPSVAFLLPWTGESCRIPGIPADARRTSCEVSWRGMMAVLYEYDTLHTNPERGNYFQRSQAVI